MQSDSSSLAGIHARSLLAQAGASDVDALRRGAHESPEAAAKKFESLLATQLVKEMRRSLGDGFFGEGPQADVYSGWLDQYLGEALARDGGLRLADGLERSLEQKQAALDAANARENAAGGEPALKSGPRTPMTTEAHGDVGESAAATASARVATAFDTREEPR